MNLRVWLAKYNKSVSWLASQCGYSIAQLSGYLNGRLKVSKRLAIILSKCTDGEVTVEQILQDNPEKKRSRKEINDLEQKSQN